MFRHYARMDKPWFQNRLRDLTKSQRGLAKAMGVDPARVTEIFNDDRQVKATELPDMAEYLECTVEDVLGRLGQQPRQLARKTIPVIGYVGAGEGIYDMQDHQRGVSLDEIEPPPDAVGNFAVLVDGNSMAPRFKDGEFLGYSREDGLDLSNCYGRECVVQTVDGRKLVKNVERGTKRSTVTLVSVNSAYPIEHDVPVEWVAPITWVKMRGFSTS